MRQKDLKPETRLGNTASLCLKTTTSQLAGENGENEFSASGLSENLGPRRLVYQHF